MSESGSTQGTTTLKPIRFNKFGAVVGKGTATHFKNRLAKLVKTHVSVKHERWKKVPAHTIDDVWKLVQGEFNVPDYMKRPIVRKMPKSYRRFKNKLREKYLDKCVNGLDKQIRNVPPRVKPEDWEIFCKYEDRQDIKERRRKNKESRSKLEYSHTGGRYSSAMIEDQLIEENTDPTVEIDRTQVWIKSHTKKDGSIVRGAETYMERVKAAIGEQDSNLTQSLDTDPIAKVFGTDSNGHVRAIGSTISKTQCAFAAPAISMLAEQAKEKNELKMEVDNLNTHMKVMNTKLDNLVEIITMFVKQGGGAQHPPSTTQGTNGLQTEGISISSTHVSRRSSESQTCKLMDMTNQVVALATVVTDKTMGVCHGYKLNSEREVKVILVSIEKPNTMIYKTSAQDGAETFEDVGSGGYLVWPKSLIEY